MTNRTVFMFVLSVILFFSSGCTFLEIATCGAAVYALTNTRDTYTCRTRQHTQRKTSVDQKAYYRDGIRRYKQFDYAGSSSNLKQSLEKENLNRAERGQAHIYRGASQYMMGQKGSARESFRKAKKEGAQIDDGIFKPEIVECYNQAN